MKFKNYLFSLVKTYGLVSNNQRQIFVIIDKFLIKNKVFLKYVKLFIKTKVT